MLCAGPLAAWAHGKEGHKNLKVLKGVDHKSFDKGMKDFSNGLGVKCTACHVKGKGKDLDDLAAKGEARKFLTAALKAETPEARTKALAPLLAALELEAPKDEPRMWSAVELWKKKLEHKDHGEHHAH